MSATTEVIEMFRKFRTAFLALSLVLLSACTSNPTVSPQTAETVITFGILNRAEHGDIDPTKVLRVALAAQKIVDTGEVTLPQLDIAIAQLLANEDLKPSEIYLGQQVAKAVRESLGVQIDTQLDTLLTPEQKAQVKQVIGWVVNGARLAGAKEPE